MDRTQKILAGLDLERASCLEIGALDRPIIPPTSPRVFYVDHLDTQGLREKYRRDASVNVDRIVDVGGVWGEKTLLQAAAPVAPVDFIVASHVIEHVPDLIGWLQELASVLKEGGEVRLAIPDRRFTFDYLRRESKLPEVLEAFVSRARVPSAGRVLDAIVYYREVDRNAAWDNQIDPAKLPGGHPVSAATDLAKDILSKGTYHDVHCWVFTPGTFCELMLGLADNGYLEFECASVQDTERDSFEFFCTLRKTSDARHVIASWQSAVQERADAAAMSEAERERRQRQLQDRITVLEFEVARLQEQRLQSAARQRETIAELEGMRRTRIWRWSAPLRALAGWGREFDRRRRGKA